MHSDRELTRLAAHKAEMRRRIGWQRTRCVELAARALQPVAWLDRLAGVWRQLSPYSKLVLVPLGLLLQRPAAPRLNLLGKLIQWAPILIGVVRGCCGSLRPSSRD